MKKILKSVFNYNTILSIMIGAIGYGVGYNLPLKFNFHPIICIICCIALGGIFDNIAKKVLSIENLTNTTKKKIFLAILVYIVYFIAWVIVDYALDYDLDYDFFPSITIYLIYQVIAFIVLTIKNKIAHKGEKK